MCEWNDVIVVNTMRGKAYADKCIAPIVEALNAVGIETVACCCGHKNPLLGNIRLADGRTLAILNTEVWSKWFMENTEVDIHGKLILKGEQKK